MPNDRETSVADAAATACTLSFDFTCHAPSDLDRNAREALETRARELLAAEGLVPAELTFNGFRSAFSVDTSWTVPQPLLCRALVRLVRGLLAALPAGTEIGGAPKLVAHGVLRRPAPRIGWDQSAVLDILPQRALAAVPDVERQLPSPAWREVFDDMQVLYWAREPLTREELQRAVLARDRWVAERPSSTLVSPDAWNAAGDRAFDRDGYAAGEGIQAWSSETHGGIEQLDVRWDGTVIDEPRFAELVALRRAGALPDGSPLAFVAIICPSRRAALAIEPRATAEGLRVLYRRGAALWEPRPAGFYYGEEPPEPPHLTLDLGFYLPAAPDPDTGAALLRRFVALAIEHGLVSPSAWLETDDRPGERLAVEELRWPQRVIHVRGDATIELSGRSRSIDARMRWRWTDGMTLIGPVTAFVRALLAEMPPRTSIDGSSLEPVGFALESRHPLRQIGRWTYGSLLDIVENEVQAWAHDPLTRDEIQRAWLAQQAWMSRDDYADLQEDWNALGDHQIATEGLVRAPPLTAYDPETGEGHKALAVTDDGATSECDLTALAELRAAGQLADGRPLTSIVVLTTSRAGAVALAPRARALGLRVAYIDNDRRVWEVSA